MTCKSRRFVFAALVFSLFFVTDSTVPLPAQDVSQKTAEQKKSQKAAKKARAEGSKKGKATGLTIGDNRATPVERIKVAKGFRVELLYSVPSAEQGSWVNLCVDNQGRILASDQYGGLFRFPAPPAGQPLDPAKVEKVPANIRAINGMVWAFDALYVAVNDYEKLIPNGMYRITDSDGDDQLDKVELLREIVVPGKDHGVHALVPTPDGKAFYLVTGNATKPIEFQKSRVPTCWGEDHLLPRMPDGRGFMRDTLGPGGIIYRVSPDGKDFEVISSGYRNIFDAAVNREGELFTYDADMEYDFNTSWYRPTRVCHAVSGSEFGWRNGAGKRPEFYADNLPPVLNIGPGSPTGMTFGYGAKFPAKYQEALFILDWSWGKLYAVHLQPTGATYTAVKEEFVSGGPLPLTDAIIHPGDGAMYFAIGGRKVQSGLYRVTYVGSESTALVEGRAAEGISVANSLAAKRHELENYHRVDPQAIDVAWPFLNHEDRFIRWAARTAVEHQPLTQWAERALAERDPGRQVEALLALARVGGIDPFHRKPSDRPVDTKLRDRLLTALDGLDWDRLNDQQRLTMVRTIEIVLNRFGRPDDGAVQKLLAKLDPLFPSPSRELNWLLCETLVYLQSPTVADKAIGLIEDVPTQEEQIEYARSLRMLKAGWTLETRKAYFHWLIKAASSFRGGASFDKFIEFIRTDAIATLTDAEKEALKEVLAEQPIRKSPLDGLSAMFAGRPKTEWKLDELASIASSNLKERNFTNGRKMFAATACFTCHRFGNEGGMTGPDLSSAGRRYTPRDLLDQIINPSKEINEQFVPMVVTTNDDEVYQGVVVNLNGDTLTLNTDPADPHKLQSIDRKEVAKIEASKFSPMPTGLLNVLTKDEILDMMAYILSGGDANNAMFRK